MWSPARRGKDGAESWEAQDHRKLALSFAPSRASRSFALALSLSLFHFPAVAGACLCFAVKHGFIYKQTRGLRDVQREERGAQGTEGSSGWVPGVP